MLSAHKRLKEEMGFDCDLTKVFSFIYKVKLDNELTEHEFDHALIGKFDGNPIINTKEAEDFRWVSLDFLKTDIRKNSNKYTYWFKKYYKKVFDTILFR